MANKKIIIIQVVVFCVLFALMYALLDAGLRPFGSWSFVGAVLIPLIGVWMVGLAKPDERQPG